jgi:hypothetical protein
MTRFTAGICLLLAGIAAWAEAPSYSYIQASYVDIELDNDIAGVDGDGFSAGGSVPINADWHVFATYSSGDFDFGVDLDELIVGAGWHTELAGTTDFVVEAGYVRAEAGAAGLSVDDNGIAASLGVRSMIRDRLEVFAGVSHVELDDAGGATSIGAGAWYTVSGNLALGINASFDDDATRLGAGIRLYFDR